MRDSNGDIRPQRHDDAFIARWARRLAFYAIPVLLTGIGYLWNDRTDRIKRLDTAVGNIATINVRIDALDRRVDDGMQATLSGQKQTQEVQGEIKGEIQALRGEVRDMYRRAIAAGGKNP